MLVGLCYDLKSDYLALGYSAEQVAEFDSIETVEALEGAIGSYGWETVRIGNLRQAVRYLAEGRSCDLLFSISEGLHGMSREAQIPALFEGYGIPTVFSDPLVLSVALDKAMTKAIVGQRGVPTPAYEVLQHAAAIESMKLSYPVFLKPVGGGTGMGISPMSLAGDIGEVRRAFGLLMDAFKQPVLAEEYLPGREFTVGIVGTGQRARALAVMEILVDRASEFGMYSYKNKQQYLEVVTYRLEEGAVAAECVEVALGAYLALGCRDGGRVDLRMDAQGKVNFIEINPLAGLHPVDSDLPMLARMAGIPYDALIHQILDSACARMVSRGSA